MFDGRDPLYLQIADQIRADVLSGALRAEEQVMSTTQYATTFRINPATAAKAFMELVDDGVDDLGEEPLAPVRLKRGARAGGDEHPDAAALVEHALVDQLGERLGGRRGVDPERGRVLRGGHDLLLRSEGP